MVKTVARSAAADARCAAPRRPPSIRGNGPRSADLPAADGKAVKNSATAKPNAMTSLTSPSLLDGGDAVIFPEQIFVVIESHVSPAVIDQNHARPAGDRASGRYGRRCPAARSRSSVPRDDSIGRAALQIRPPPSAGCTARSGNSDRPSVAEHHVRPWIAARCRCRRAASRLPSRFQRGGRGAKVRRIELRLGGNRAGASRGSIDSGIECE